MFSVSDTSGRASRPDPSSISRFSLKRFSLGRLSLGRFSLGRFSLGRWSLGLVAALAAATMSLAACGPTPADPDCVAETCPDSCTLDADCAVGTHCAEDGQCVAECNADADCASGDYCTDAGRCEPLFTDPGTGGSGGGDICADVQLELEAVEPTVMLLIDQSGSMTASYPGGNRWDVLFDALMSPGGVVPQLDSQVRFGLTLYTSENGNSGGTCPMLSEVATAGDNFEAMYQLYAQAEPVDETPTGESLALVADKLATMESDGPRIIILATDGEPDTCAEPNPQNGQAEAIAAAQHAYANGIETYVLAVGSDVGAAHLQDMANAGAGLEVGGSQDAPFYQPADQQGLVDDFLDIINGQRSCVLTLNGEIDPELAHTGTVTLDGDPLTLDDPDGWQINSATEIELLGAACEAIKTGDHDIQGTFPCNAVVEDPQ